MRNLVVWGLIGTGSFVSSVYYQLLIGNRIPAFVIVWQLKFFFFSLMTYIDTENPNRENPNKMVAPMHVDIFTKCSKSGVIVVLI